MCAGSGGFKTRDWWCLDDLLLLLLLVLEVVLDSIAWVTYAASRKSLRDLLGCFLAEEFLGPILRFSGNFAN
jgi:hypothetical protein